VQKAVQHLVLGTAAPASHSSDLSTTPFPQTAAAAFDPDTATGGMIGVFDADCGGRVFEGVLDWEAVPDPVNDNATTPELLGTTTLLGATPELLGTTALLGATPELLATTALLGATPELLGTTALLGATPELLGTTALVGATPELLGTTALVGATPLLDGAGPLLLGIPVDDPGLVAADVLLIVIDIENVAFVH